MSDTPIDVDLTGGDWAWDGTMPRPVAIAVANQTRLVGITLGGTRVDRVIKAGDAYPYAMRAIDAALTEPKTGITVYRTIPLSTRIGRNRNTADERDLFESHRVAADHDEHVRVALEYADLGIR